MANKVKRNNFPSDQIEIRNKFVKAIESGEIKVGEMLPSIHSVSSKYKYSWGSTENAFKIMEAEGYIKKKKNKRYYAVGPKKNKPVTNVGELYDASKRPDSIKESDPMFAEPKKEVKVKKRKPVSKKVVINYIADQINNELLKDGEFVPTCKELSNKFGCSVSTAQYALEDLRKMGLIKLEHKENGRPGNMVSITNHEIHNEEEAVICEIPGTVVENTAGTVQQQKKHKNTKRNMEFKIVSSVSGVRIAVTPTGNKSFVIYVDRG